MSLSNQSQMYMNSEIIRRHDHIMELNSNWAQHLNYLLGLSFWDESEDMIIQDEFYGTICYDV